jgi:hypothetical protein
MGPALFKEDNTADGCFPARPEGIPQIPHPGVAALAKGITITCELRLVLGDLGDSDFSMQSDTVHQRAWSVIAGESNRKALIKTSGPGFSSSFSAKQKPASAGFCDDTLQMVAVIAAAPSTVRRC